MSARTTLLSAITLIGLRPVRRECLDRADEALANTTLYLRLAERWKWLGGGQYLHAAKMTVEIGKLLGGWKAAKS